MTDKITTAEAIETIESILNEATEDGVCYATSEDSEALKMAIEALELHTPTKPNWQGDEKCMDAYCPNCGTYLDDGENPCDKCTQLIDWSDSNE